MSVIDLKAYTTRAVELESAIYTQKELMKQYEEHLKKQHPLIPSKKNMRPAPSAPGQYVEVEKSSAFKTPIIVSLILLGINIWAYSVGEWVSITIPLTMVGIAILLFARAFFKSKEIERLNTENRKKNESEWNRYNNLVQQRSAEQKRIDTEYEQEYSKYQLRVKEHIEKTTTLMVPHKDLLRDLENALNEHYAQNVLFPKYRNMVAITTINEYLMSGRCYELEGPNGAYNLYEMELRQNVIVGQLSSIISGLEQIRNNQFSLYQEIVKANATVSDILREVEGVRENARMTAYFAGVTALIEASPKVYIGHTF